MLVSAGVGGCLGTPCVGWEAVCSAPFCAECCRFAPVLDITSTPTYSSRLTLHPAAPHYSWPEGDATAPAQDPHMAGLCRHREAGGEAGGLVGRVWLCVEVARTPSAQYHPTMHDTAPMPPSTSVLQWLNDIILKSWPYYDLAISTMVKVCLWAVCSGAGAWPLFRRHVV